MRPALNARLAAVAVLCTAGAFAGGFALANATDSPSPSVMVVRAPAKMATPKPIVIRNLTKAQADLPNLVIPPPRVVRPIPSGGGTPSGGGSTLPGGGGATPSGGGGGGTVF